MLAKLKKNMSELVFMDTNDKSKAWMRFQNSLHSKFFEKPLPFQQVKMSMHAKQSDLGVVHISGLPNDYLLIHFETHNVMQKLMLDGLWHLNGNVLQLAP